jgi:hypothetical protein
VFGHPYWAPAYVGFFGWGGGLGVGIGFGFGGLGWVPLAPFEVFHPWYGRGFYAGFRGGGFARGTTIVNNTNITGMYRNARVNGGVSGVAANQFGRSGAQVQSLNHAQIQQAGLVRGAVPVAPGRSSLQMSNRIASGNVAQSRSQSFASHTQAPQVSHVSFAQQQRGMQHLSHSDFSAPSRGAAGSSAAPSSRGAGTAGAISAGSSAAGASHGWNRFGEPIHGASSGTSQPTQSGGWKRSETTRPSGGSTSATGTRSFGSYSGGSGQAIRISPPIVQQRSPSYQAPRSSGSSNGSSTRSSGTGTTTRSSSSGSSGTTHATGGTGGHASGGGHGGGGHR